jgi:hypothetical protein
MRDLLPCILRLLNIKPTDEVNKKLVLPNKGEFWKKLRVPVKAYISDILQVNF